MGDTGMNQASASKNKRTMLRVQSMLAACSAAFQTYLKSAKTSCHRTQRARSSQTPRRRLPRLAYLLLPMMLCPGTVLVAVAEFPQGRAAAAFAWGWDEG